MKHYLTNLFYRLLVLVGWKRYMVAMLAGGLLVLSYPPVYGFPLLFVVFPIIFLLLGSCYSGVQAFIVGWWFNSGLFFLSCYWVPYELP